MTVLRGLTGATSAQAAPRVGKLAAPAPAGGRPLRLGLAALAAVAALGTVPAGAAEIRFTKGMQSSVTVTDNVDLAPEGSEEAAIVTSAGPTAQLTVDGNRLDLLFAGSLQLQHFSNDNAVRLDQNLRGSATAELWEDWLYLDLEGSSSRQLTEPDSRVSASDSSRGDRESVTVLEASPYLAHNFGNWAEGELRYRRTQTFSGGDSGDSVQDEQIFRLESGTRFTRTRLGLLLERIDEESDDGDGPTGLQDDNDDVERSTAELAGQYAVWRRFSVTGTAGYDKVESSDDRDLGGPFYMLGFDTRPGPRSEFALGVGERYGGLWVEGDFSYDITERLTLTGEIDRILETGTDRLSDRRRGRVVDPVTGELVTEDLNEDDQDGLAVTWRGTIGLDGVYGRNTFNLDLLYVDRQFEDSSDTTYGLRGGWTRQLSRRWSTRLSGFATRVDGEPQTTTVGAQLSLDYLVYTNTIIAVGVSRTERFADQPGDEYTENTATVIGRIRF